jgi:hypothetical protein
MINENKTIIGHDGLKSALNHRNRREVLIVSVLFFCLALLVLGWLNLQENSDQLFQYSYLLPSITLVFVIVSIPGAYLIIKGSFDLFHPLVYAAWSYFFPAFVLGSLYLATGLHDNYMSLIPNPEYYIPLTLNYIALGFAGLILGFILPLGNRIGEGIARKLPVWEWEVSNIFKPALFLILFGELSKLGAYEVGNFGFQSMSAVSTYGATLAMVGFLSTMGSFLLWFAIFSTQHLKPHHYLGAFLLLMLIVYTTLLGGGKGGLFVGMLLLIGAYILSGRRVNPWQALVLGSLITVTLFLGMAYGTVFRQIKGNESQVSLQDYLGFGSDAVDLLSRQGFEDNLAISMNAFLPRIETLSQAAVYVANYERVRPLEASYGIADIWTMTWTAFIPRAVWPDKPVISGARGLALLYFKLSGTSPAITPMTDLLRNFGPIGIPLGMALLGVILQIIYTTLIQGQKISAWRVVGYYLLLTSISYEGMYGSILPVLIRVCAVVFIGLVFVNAWMPLRGQAYTLKQE